jgi:hypothetical protein
MRTTDAAVIVVRPGSNIATAEVATIGGGVRL